jgi:hypothetical protein
MDRLDFMFARNPYTEHLVATALKIDDWLIDWLIDWWVTWNSGTLPATANDYNMCSFVVVLRAEGDSFILH